MKKIKEIQIIEFDKKPIAICLGIFIVLALISLTFLIIGLLKHSDLYVNIGFIGMYIFGVEIINLTLYIRNREIEVKNLNLELKTFDEVLIQKQLLEKAIIKYSKYKQNSNKKEDIWD